MKEANLPFPARHELDEEELAVRIYFRIERDALPGLLDARPLDRLIAALTERRHLALCHLTDLDLLGSILPRVSAATGHSDIELG